MVLRLSLTLSRNFKTPSLSSFTSFFLSLSFASIQISHLSLSLSLSHTHISFFSILYFVLLGLFWRKQCGQIPRPSLTEFLLLCAFCASFSSNDTRNVSIRRRVYRYGALKTHFNLRPPSLGSHRNPPRLLHRHHSLPSLPLPHLPPPPSPRRRRRRRPQNACRFKGNPGDRAPPCAAAAAGDPRGHREDGPPCRGVLRSDFQWRGGEWL